MKKQNPVLNTLNNRKRNKMKIGDIITLLDNAPSHDDKYYIEVIDNETFETLLCERVSTVLFMHDDWLDDKVGILNSEIIAMSPNVIDENGLAHDGLTLYI